MRREYEASFLERNSLESHPLAQFAVWYEEACQKEPLEPNALALATASLTGRPSCRMVLMKSFDRKGIDFFTNFNSCKGRELEGNSWAAATFWWPTLQRQVRIAGKTEKLPQEQSEKYFSSRPRSSQLAAWCSPQSEPIASRELLEQAFEKQKERWEGKAVELPPYWGGYKLVAAEVQFWQGRANRLHDVFRYLSLNEEGNSWRIDRLAP